MSISVSMESDDSSVQSIPSAPYAKDDDWERNRATITQLYVTDDKTLNQVRDIMERRLGFRAT